ncbi:MAG: hypothetical protein FJ044_02800 [Candidatus Cloacimonetes bacterium]|nr:hypothetical protein [Candidatus Cloacimonadota bacterium]
MEQSVNLTPIAITGSSTPKDNAFSKTFLYRPADKNLHACRGELYACLSLASPDPSLDLENLSNQILTSLTDSYFGQRKGSCLNALSLAADQARKRALELTQREGGQIPLDFSFAAAAVWGKAAFVSIFGGGYTALFRGNELIPEGSNRLFSEELKDSDVLILATPLFATRIGEEKIAEILRNSPQEELNQNLKEIITQKEEQSRLAAVFLQVEIEEVPGEEEVIEILDVPKQEPIYTSILRKFRNLTSQFQISYFTDNRVNFKFQTGKVFGFLRNFSFFIFHLLFRRGEAEPTVYLKEQKSTERSKKIAIVGILIILLIVSVLGTRRWNKRTEKNRQAQNLLAQAEEKISQSEKAITVNPERAKKLLDEARDSLGEVAGMQVSQKEIEDLQAKMGEILGQAYSTEKLESLLVADLALKVGDGNFRELVKLGEKLYSLDTNSGKITGVDLENENKVETLPTTYYLPPTTNQFLAGYLDSLYIYDPKQGVVEINPPDRRVNGRTGSSKVVIPTDANWQEITGLETYFGNLYLLDPPGNRIFKYLAIEAGFSKFFDYFSQNVNLSNVKSFAIDGAVYLLFDDSVRDSTSNGAGGRVEKYLGGARQEFGLSGLYPPMTDASCIYTNPDAEKLYISLENFILVFNKKGAYEKRLQIEGLSQINDLIVDEKGGKAWFLGQGRIYETNLE